MGFNTDSIDYHYDPAEFISGDAFDRGWMG